jgi:hypothetical protein
MRYTPGRRGSPSMIGRGSNAGGAGDMTGKAGPLRVTSGLQVSCAMGPEQRAVAL